LEVIDTRTRLRHEAERADRERRQAAILLQVAHELARVTEPTEIPPILAAAIRKASSASFAAIARVPPEGSGLEFVAGDGLTAAQETLFQRGSAGGSAGASPFPLVADLLAGKATLESTEDGPSDAPEAGMDTFAAASIVIDGQAWGIVGLGANDDLPFAQDWWMELAQGFASIAATALARAEAVAALARQRDVLASDVAERTLRLTAAVEELQRASDAKTAFLGTVSHELRTPLTAILGFVEILDTGMDGPLNQAQAQDIRTVQSSSRHLLELIDDLIDVSSIEAGQIQLSRDSVAIDELVRESVETMRPMAGEKGISLEADSVEAVLADGDHGRLREIVLNLLSNALKFTPSGGRIRVSALADPATGDQPAMARIDVRDSGIGIAGADTERIFETFVRAAGPSYAGTGLG
ncbi:MAG TPA: histidine kinase dimerization/phospho-acceptor domain-containing protein, partial [Candidatus Limnocylindrales bacterium]